MSTNIAPTLLYVIFAFVHAPSLFAVHVQSDNVIEVRFTSNLTRSLLPTAQAADTSSATYDQLESIEADVSSFPTAEFFQVTVRSSSSRVSPGAAMHVPFVQRSLLGLSSTP
jgi:hypothetical protein